MNNYEVKEQLDAKSSTNLISSIANRTKNASRTTLVLIICFVITAVLAATFMASKMVENNDQSKKLEEIQSQIYEKAKQLEAR